jgi:hypothetical protein
MDGAKPSPISASELYAVIGSAKAPWVVDARGGRKCQSRRVPPAHFLAACPHRPMEPGSVARASRPEPHPEQASGSRRALRHRLAASVFREVRDCPFAGVLDRRARRLGRAKALDGQQRLHLLPPFPNPWEVRVHRLLGSETEQSQVGHDFLSNRICPQSTAETGAGREDAHPPESRGAF